MKAYYFGQICTCRCGSCRMVHESAARGATTLSMISLFSSCSFSGFLFHIRDDQMSTAATNAEETSLGRNPVDKRQNELKQLAKVFQRLGIVNTSRSSLKGESRNPDPDCIWQAFLDSQVCVERFLQHLFCSLWLSMCHRHMYNTAQGVLALFTAVVSGNVLSFDSPDVCRQDLNKKLEFMSQIVWS